MEIDASESNKCSFIIVVDHYVDLILNFLILLLPPIAPRLFQNLLLLILFMLSLSK